MAEVLGAASLYSMKTLFIALSVLLLGVSSVQAKEPALDFTTPEGAILKLEEAYRNKDIEAAVAAKDFTTEAGLMLSDLKHPLAKDPEVLKKTAETLELAFRAEIKKEGFPDFSDLKSKFAGREKYKDFKDVVVVTEICTFPDGGTSKQRILVACTAKGWGVMHPLE